MVANGKYNQNQLLQGENLLPVLSSGASSISSNLAINPTLMKSSIHTSSAVNNSTAVFVSNALCGVTGQAIASTASLGDGINETGWRMSELVGAVCLASTVTAGSLFLGPFGNFKGDGVGAKGGNGGGSNGPGGGGGGHKKVGGAGSGNESKYEEVESNEPQVKVGIATVPPAYEVSVYVSYALMF
jgi:hypothetical protein